MQKHKTLLFVFSISLLMSSCLVTRGQLKNESDEQSYAAPPVNEVQPKGQYILDEVKQELTRIEGRLEDLERFQKHQDSQSLKHNELDQLKQRLEKIEEEQVSIRNSLEKSLAKNPEELFDVAKAFYQDQKYEEALDKFEVYLKIPKTKKTDEATFMKGECLYKLKKYKKAIVEYSKLQEKFKKSNRMAEALYRIGLSFEALGMGEDAQGFYQEVIEKYPKSPEAKKSKQKVK